VRENRKEKKSLLNVLFYPLFMLGEHPPIGTCKNFIFVRTSLRKRMKKYDTFTERKFAYKSQVCIDFCCDRTSLW